MGWDRPRSHHSLAASETFRQSRSAEMGQKLSHRRSSRPEGVVRSSRRRILMALNIGPPSFAIAIAFIGNTVLAQTLEGRLKQISDTKVVKLAHRSDANPFSFVNAQGQPDGYTVDLCKFVVQSLELQLNAKLTIAWVPVDTKNRFDAIATGLADMECGASTVSFERMTKVDFSSFVFMENTGVLVRTS